jgi:hypothetical protein
MKSAGAMEQINLLHWRGTKMVSYLYDVVRAAQKDHMKERQKTAEVFKRIRDEIGGACAVEVKVAHRGHAIAFAALEEHQERALLLAAGAGMYWKISDDTFGQKPFDGFILCGAEAYVAILWPRMSQGRGYETLTVLRIQDWLSEREAALGRGKKSLFRERAVELSLLK